MAPVLLAFGIALLISTLGRLAILAWQHERLVAAGIDKLPFVLLQGWRFDLLTLGVFFGIPVTLTPVMLTSRRLAPYWARFLGAYSIAVILVMAFMELATPSFINEFDAKPDRRFIEYLVYPNEVAAMLWGAYKLPLLGTAIALLVVGNLSWRLLWTRFREIQPISLWAPLILVPLCAFATLAAIRSTMDHRPVNPSTVVFSRDPLANSFALNSSYTALYALYELNKEEKRFAYRSVDRKSAVRAAQLHALLPAEQFTDPDSTLHRQSANRDSARPLNVVIILEESLGAEFVGSLGGLPLTPEIDALRNDGIWFERLYATGVRSVRGIEAVVTGFPPTTSRSVVKLPRSQRDFFTLAELLEQQGYDTSFLYGGEPQFDNMARFFANNGFQSIIGRHDFTGEVFDAAWGVADEDLFRLAHERFAAQPPDRPFFSLVFTTSNHSPWDFPAGRIELYEEPAATRHNAVKYADYAVGEFIRNARRSEYWDNTVFLIIADHCSRVYGAELVPIERFRVPALILGGSIEPATITRVASQMDMIPTLLSLIGITATHPGVGIDQTRDDLGDFPGRAVMQYGGNQAYMEGDDVVILQRQQPVTQYVYRDQALVPAQINKGLAAQAEGFANWPWLAYRDGSYRLPPAEQATRRAVSGPDVNPASGRMQRKTGSGRAARVQNRAAILSNPGVLTGLRTPHQQKRGPCPRFR